MSTRVFAGAPGALEAGARVRLDAEESHYLRRVRRARDGAAIEIFDGVGGLWSATLEGGDPKASVAAIIDAVPLPPPPPRLTLLLGLPEPSAALQAITQATELGAAAIVLVRCARSQNTHPGPARVERVLRAAQRQCGRPLPPHVEGVEGPLGLAEALAIAADDPGYFAWEALRGQDAPPPRVSAGARLLVGPEGGLTRPEADQAAAAGLQPLALGPWTLRTETAALVGLTRLLFAP